MLYYIDTNVWLDYLRDRNSASAEVFIRIIKNHDSVLLSEILMMELDRYSDISELRMMLTLLNISNEIIIATPEMNAEAMKLSKHRDVPFADALHAIIAREHVQY